MNKEIEKELVNLRIQEKDARRESAKVTAGLSLFTALLVAVAYLYPQYSSASMFAIIFGLIAFAVGLSLPRPLSEESYCFRRVAEAVDILEKSTEPIAYEEAYRCLRKAHKLLAKITEALPSHVWYGRTNEAVERFAENFELIVLPETRESNIRRDHLEEIALVFSSRDITKINEVNGILESDYKKHEPLLPRKEIIKRRFQESIIGQVSLSLALGYGAILLICLIYTLATVEDFMSFVRENPTIVILGGAAISGATFWKKK